MKTSLIVVGAALLGFVVGPVRTSAQEPDQDLAERLHRLEAQTQVLNDEVQQLRDNPGHATGVTPASATMEEADPSQAGITMDQVRGEIKKFAWSKGDFTVVPYGFLWGNMVYETERTNPGSFTYYVFSGAEHGDHNFVLDGRNTRIGLDVSGPRIPFFDCATSGGKVEIDFQGASTASENKGTVLLRHAYWEVKDDDFRLLMGQTWDVVSPLYPGTLMYSVGWGGGNIGYRRAQLRAERYLAFSDESLLTLQGSLNQSLSDSAATVTTTTGLRGEMTPWPILEGRVGLTLGERKGPDALPWTFGASAHVGEQGWDIGTAAPDEDIRRRTWSFNIDVRKPLTHNIGVQGEFFTGENLSTFQGGILQGINPDTLQGICSTGGWFELWYDVSEDLHTHVGYSVDDPNDGQVNVGGRTFNQFYFGNVSYDLTKRFLVGLEVSSWKTLYKGLDPGDSVHFEFVGKYGF